VATPFSLDHIGLSLQAENLDATIDWYARTLGFAVERRFEVNGNSFAFITNNGLRIELVAAASSPNASPTTDIAASHTSERLHHLCLAVEDLDATLTDLSTHDVHPISGPFDIAGIGQRFAFITDNLGNIIEFTEPGGPRS
jgi:catechol 2,3-dioxygenase-like lactoylglutathione lyase family enzyme